MYFRFEPEYPEEQTSNFAVNVFGFFNGEGLSEIHELKPRFNSQDFINLIHDHLIPSVRELYPQPDDIYIFVDKRSLHKSQNVVQYLYSLPNTYVIDVPEMGSDMNPIQNIWAMMTRHITINKPIWTKDEFRPEVSIAWEWVVNRELYLLTLSSNMRDRLRAVIGNQGRWTKY